MKIEIGEDAQVWQSIARIYADEHLQPHEVEAELNDGGRELSVEPQIAIRDGTSEIQRPIIARSLLKRGLDRM